MNDIKTDSCFLFAYDVRFRSSSYLVYDPKPPKRNTVDSQQPWLYGTIPGQREKVTRERVSLMPLIFRQRPPSPPHIVTRFHITRPFTAKKQFVTEGMYPAGEYEAPKPHDFSQVSVTRISDRLVSQVA